ncbi:hypothetical protein [Undibacterium crateris]|uniref:hypothetical protein n=1 Tax=Undibacterium crateris TaxID=2528175 RepID=UPI001389539A|nr:hypothetical protein [Undibacterium crateris]NDI85428.1 hypothetical protein [Undibacterium crateris]
MLIAIGFFMLSGFAHSAERRQEDHEQLSVVDLESGIQLDLSLIKNQKNQVSSLLFKVKNKRSSENLRLKLPIPDQGIFQFDIYTKDGELISKPYYSPPILKEYMLPNTVRPIEDREVVLKPGQEMHFSFAISDLLDQAKVNEREFKGNISVIGIFEWRNDVPNYAKSKSIFNKVQGAMVYAENVDFYNSAGKK